MNSITNAVRFYDIKSNPIKQFDDWECDRIWFTRVINSTITTHEAVFLRDTFILKNTIQTINDYKNALVKASTTPERIKRAILSLLITSITVALVVSTFFLAKFPLNLFFPIFLTVPLGLIIIFMGIPLMLGAECVYKNWIEINQRRATNTAHALINNKDAIQTWLEKQRLETQELIGQEKARLTPSTNIVDQRTITHKIHRLSNDLVHISLWLDKFKELQQLSQDFLKN